MYMLNDISALKENIIDQVLEIHLKLGFYAETIHLYYPVRSVKNLVDPDAQIHIKDLISSLRKADFGFPEDLVFLYASGRVCISVPPAVSAYIRDNYKMSDFFVKLLTYISHDEHGHLHEDPANDTESVIPEDFQAFLDNTGQPYCIDIPSGSEGFDFAVRFEDPDYDHYCYCFRKEGGHITYHRFTPADYRELFGNSGIIDTDNDTADHP